MVVPTRSFLYCVAFNHCCHGPVMIQISHHNPDFLSQFWAPLWIACSSHRSRQSKADSWVICHWFITSLDQFLLHCYHTLQVSMVYWSSSSWWESGRDVILPTSHLLCLYMDLSHRFTKKSYGYWLFFSGECWLILMSFLFCLALLTLVKYIQSFWLVADDRNWFL